jgi:hypothetical protein
MTLILVILVVASLASMAWAFAAAAKFEAAAVALEARVKSRLDQPPPSATDSDKGAHR